MSDAQRNPNQAQIEINSKEYTEARKVDTEHQETELKIEANQVRKTSQYDVSFMIGADLVHQDQVALAKAKERARFAREALKNLGDGVPIEVKDIEDELLDIHRSKQERSQAKASSNNSAGMLESEDEVDVSDVLRPELVLQKDLSAIAIPRIVQREGHPAGQWPLYIQESTGRRVELLGNELHTGNGTYLLSPLPYEPSASDIQKLNRWSSASRKTWLGSEAAPTTAETLEMVAGRIKRYIVFPSDASETHLQTLAAWILLTYAYPAVEAIPYVHLSGPAGSGKSRTMDVLARMAFRPLMTSNTSAATVFRTRHAYGGTLLIDEAERMRDTRSPDVAELQSVLLAGYRRGGSATRLEPYGDTYKATTFDCYGPVVLGCIKGLPPALSSRCITVKMIRASRADPQSERSLSDSPVQASETLDTLHRWSLEHAYRVVTTACEIGNLANRDAELWGPLLSIVADANDESAFDLLLQHAEQMTVIAASDAQPEFDEVILRAFYQLRIEGQLPTAGEILERAKAIDPETLDESWKPRSASRILKPYFEMKKSNGRKVYKDTPEAIRSLASLYGYDVDGGAK